MKGSAKKIFPIALAVVCIAMMMNSAAAQPVPPWSFHGEAEINGRPVPEGSVVYAKIDGLERGRRTVTQEGYYGRIMSEGGDGGVLSVDPWEDGDIVSFFIQAPGMSNTIQAEETGEIDDSEDGVTRLSLTFTGEEIPKPADSSSSGDTGSDTGGAPAGSSGTMGTGDQEDESEDEGGVEETEPPQQESNANNIDAELESGELTIELKRTNQVEFTAGFRKQSLEVKSLSDFGALVNLNGNDVIFGIGETMTFDFDGDGSEDVSITLESARNERAEFKFEKHTEPAEIEPAGMATAVSGGTSGMMTGSVGSMAAVIIMIVAVVLLGVYIMKTRGRRGK